MLNEKKLYAMLACSDIAKTLAKKGEEIRSYVEYVRRNNHPEENDKIRQLERLLDLVRQTHSESVATARYLNEHPDRF